jgi:hypothetical protein
MAQMTASNPISDLMYDWLTVLQNKAEGVSAYEKYIRDAEEAGAHECVEMFRKLHERDVQMLEEVKEHVYGMIRNNKG